MGRRPLTGSGASSAGRALSSGPGRSRPRPAPRTFGFQSPQPLGGARSRVGGPEEEEAAQNEEAVPRAPARGRAELACAPALGAGGRAVSPQPPRRRRLDWRRLPRARLRGGRGGGRADCAPGGRRSGPAPE